MAAWLTFAALARNSPFPDFWLPGLALAGIVGGGMLGAATLLWRRRPYAREVGMATGAALVVFELIEFVVILHDRDDVVIPVGESRRLRDALAGRAGVSYTEFTLFQHMDPSKAQRSPVGLLRQLGLFYRAVYPVFRLALVPRCTRVPGVERHGTRRPSA